MIIDSLQSLAYHLPRQAARTAVAVSSLDRPLGEFKEDVPARALPWAAGAVAAFVAYQILLGRRGVLR